ncbi:MAG: hypothetical protein MJ077_06485 [Oscillospiraceae bacterium]|nr:hypothetical protein [Oscillospiraceae bacterium]
MSKQEREIVNTNIRFVLSKEEHRRAYELLSRIDRRKYKSYTEAVVAAVNAFFGRQEQLAANPYLETREKEDAFLQRLLDTVHTSVTTAIPTVMVGSLMNMVQTPSVAQAPALPSEDEEEEADEESISDALSFVDSF